MTEAEFESVFDHLVVEHARVAFGGEEEEGHEDHGHDRRRHRSPSSRFSRRDTGIACQSASQVFANADLNRDLVLAGSELVEAFAQVATLRLFNCFAVNCNVKPTSAQTWGLGFASVIVITLVSFLAVVILPISKTRVAHHVLTTLVAFGFGAIAGDTIFHILPFLFELHGHGGSSSADANRFSYRMAVVFAAFLAFYVLDRIITAFFAARGKLHTHTHTADGQSHDDSEGRVADADTAKSKSTSSAHPGEIKEEASKLNLRAISSLGWMNLFSDGVHNFVDGLALGAAWSVSLSLGLGTSLAILFHEIPQEISDFSILVRAGFPRRWALVVNALSGLPAILGLVIAIPIAESAQDAQMWVLAVTAGGFFYISWTLLIPDLMARRVGLAHQLEVSLGMAVGFLALILLAVYEDDIIFGFCF